MSEPFRATEMEAHNKNNSEVDQEKAASAEAVKALQMELADLRKLIRVANISNSIPKAERN
ncbi:MAG TPA: hypothetical protein VK138_05720 [Acidiferrobacterales bacterium]|nr:hypothetical protein [Acidiferrobacterales bacterium]